MAFGGGSYEIRIKGRLSDSMLAAFEGLTATVEPVETVLHGPMEDQSSLRGLLDRIQSLDLELVEIRRLPTSPDEAAAEPEPPAMSPREGQPMLGPFGESRGARTPGEPRRF